MEGRPDISVIIPTFNRRDLVCRALDSVIGQTHPVDQIIVVDDGSTDGTAAHLRHRYASRVLIVEKPNGGVSAARNAGLATATGRYLALLDSDDVWLPQKTRLQYEWLEQRPDYGMVLCDVVRTDLSGTTIDVLHRRSALPEDGWIMKWALLNPALVPSTVLMRREVTETVGRFDESLATGEDLDFHLRVARHWKIGVVAQPLVRAVRGHDGLSSLKRTVSDYLEVMGRAYAASSGIVSDEIRSRALALAYARAAKEHVYAREWGSAWVAVRGVLLHEPDVRVRTGLLTLLPLALRRIVSAVLRKEPATTQAP